jgi:hypothetical protein
MPGTKLTRTAEVYPGEVQRTKVDESKSTPRLIHDGAAYLAEQVSKDIQNSALR